MHKSHLSARDWVELYSPALLGIGLTVLAGISIVGVIDFPIDFLAVLAGAMLTIVGLHRGHEYHHGITLGKTSGAPAAAYSFAIGGFMVALYLNSVVAALLSSVMLIGSVYYFSRGTAAENSGSD